MEFIPARFSAYSVITSDMIRTLIFKSCGGVLLLTYHGAFATSLVLFYSPESLNYCDDIALSEQQQQPYSWLPYFKTDANI